MKLLIFIKKLLCKHDFENVENSQWYFNKKCKKCGLEKGIGKFKYK